MLQALAYPLVIERHETDGGYLAYFPSLPGCQTWGEAYQAAVQNAKEALAVFVETLASNGDPIPDSLAFHGPAALTKGRTL